MITEQERRQRRVTYRMVQLALVLLTVGLGVGFVLNKRQRPSGPDLRITTHAPSASELATGDIQIFNVDSAVDLVLRGRTVYAGLSPKTVEKIRARLSEPTSGDPKAIGNLIASAVKEQVADKIEAHMQYDIDDIEDIRYEDEGIVFQWKSGKSERLFESVKVGDGKTRFRREDAERFIERFKARKRGSG